MNAEQLWETTSTPCAFAAAGEGARGRCGRRYLHQLMGDDVDPRRTFIQDNALSVANLDV
ncbi:MAG: hypothetical protein HPM95_19255 [Alphaproteobacteria bacterium]|nr:hypothetical protein [Alphaproteobacteria bacterium]